MRTIRSLLYISRGNIPSKAANSMQQVKMAQAFADELPHVELTTAGDIWRFLGLRRFDFRRWYGLHGRLRIRCLPTAFNLAYPLPANAEPPRYLSTAIRYARWHKPDIIFTRSTSIVELAANADLPVILETHDLANDYFLRCWSHERVRRYLRGVVTIAPILTDSYIQAGVQRVHTLTLPDGVDLERFADHPTRAAARAKLGFPIDKPIIGYVGHLYEHRGIEDMFEVARQRPHWQFVLVGGWEKDVKRRQAEIDVSDLGNIQLVGFVPNQDVPQHLAAMDVLLMPMSQHLRTAAWMSPMKMFEYMAARRPIIANDLPVLRTVLRDGENALLIPPDQPAALQAAIQRLLDLPALGTEFAEQAYRDVQQYTWRQRARQIIDWMQTL